MERSGAMKMPAPKPRANSTLKPKSKPATLGIDNFRADPLYPRVERAVASILAAGGKVVAPVDAFIAMRLLDPAELADWRRGRVPYLEKVMHADLSRLSRVLRILRFHAHDLNLAPSQTAYHRHGKGPKQPLRFTRTGEVNLEAAYSRHFVWPGKEAPGVLRAKPAGGATPDSALYQTGRP